MPWAIGVAAVLLIGVLFGGFYAYQHRKANAGQTPSDAGEEMNANSLTVEPSPVTEHAASEPASGSLNEENQGVHSNQTPLANEPARKNEKTATNNENAGQKPAGSRTLPPPDTGGQHPNMKSEPETSNAQEMFIPNTAQRGKQMGETTTKTFPDGTQVTTLADGTRIVTMPNGTKRVFRPGQRIIRKRGLR